MPWKEVTVMSEKERFVDLALSEKANVSELCRRFGISRKTGYKLIQRYKKEGLSGLVARSRRPQGGKYYTSQEMKEKIFNLREKYPHWGGEKLRVCLLREGITGVPSEKTIDRVLKREGYISQEASERAQAWKRFEHAEPNDLWQIDFKGHFATQRERCHPLTLLDDHSRYSLLIKACIGQTKDTVKPCLIEVFREYGLPKKMTMDNGSPWGHAGERGHTQLTACLIRVGIYVSHARPYHPQTQGKLERFHRTLKEELLKETYFGSLIEAQKGFDIWRKIYNEERPHGAIGFKTPRERYTKSVRLYPETLPPIEYEPDLVVRKVQQKGILSLQGKEYRVGHAFYGCPVGLKESEEGIMDVYFCHQRISKINLRAPEQ